MPCVAGKLLPSSRIVRRDQDKAGASGAMPASAEEVCGRRVIVPEGQATENGKAANLEDSGAATTCAFSHAGGSRQFPILPLRAPRLNVSWWTLLDDCE